MREPSYENRNSDLMNAEIYNALRSAGVAENEAEKAAKASAKDSMQYIQLNQKIDGSVGELKQDIGNVDHKVDISVAELKQDIGNLDHKVDISVAELKQDIGNLDHKVDISVAELKQDIGNVDHKVDNLDQKVDSSVERLDQKIDSSVERLEQKIDNKSNTTHALLIGLVVIVVAQIIAQYFF